jgi:steroid 5-alpha reductase family enzyme
MEQRMSFHKELFDILIFHQPLVLLLLFQVAFLIALRCRNYGIVDLFWGLGFVAVALVSVRSNRVLDERSLVVLTLVCLWGLRLFFYLFFRLLKKPEEDYRYASLRMSWQPNANLQAWFKVFILQPVVCWLIAAPMGITLMRSTVPWNLFDWIGVILATSGLIIESLADYQMGQFKKDLKNSGKLIRSGLWKHSRHPNYFGEMLFWWGIAWFALNSVLPWIAFNGAILITFLLIKVTGAPLLDEKNRQRPGWEDYLKETNAFLPLQWRG